MARVYTGCSDRWHEDYELGRPGWPPEVVGIPGLQPAATVLELAAGTGKLTRLLVSTFEEVIAVEPDEGMRRLLVPLCPQARVLPASASAEEIPLADGPVDGVTLDLGYLPLATGVPQLNVLRFVPEAWLVALVKPVTELGLCELPQEDRAVDDAVDLACRGIAGAGWRIEQTIRSPLTGSRGAVEAFVHARRQTRP